MSGPRGQRGRAGAGQLIVYSAVLVKFKPTGRAWPRFWRRRQRVLRFGRSCYQVTAGTGGALLLSEQEGDHSVYTFQWADVQEVFGIPARIGEGEDAPRLVKPA